MLGDPSHLDKAYLADARRSRVEARRWRRRRGRAGAFAALLGAAREWRHVASAAARRNAGQPGAQQPAAAVDAAGFCTTASSAATPTRAGQGLRVDQLAGLEVERVFRRRSGVPLSTPMPRLYTREVFKQSRRKAARSSSSILDEGCMGLGREQVASLASAGALSRPSPISTRQDYIRAWDALLDDLQFVSVHRPSRRPTRRCAS